MRLEVKTGYPWSGDVEVTVRATPSEPWTLTLRVPDWSPSATLRMGDGVVATARGGERSVALSRAWQVDDMVSLRLDIAPRITLPDPRVDAIRGTLAIERGPLVYCLETADLPAGLELEEVRLPVDATITETPRDDLGEGTVGVTVAAAARGKPLEVGAIPYHQWANRGVAAMRVWVPEPEPEGRS